jgi:hypothetical protein
MEVKEKRQGEVGEVGWGLGGGERGRGKGR